MRVACTSTSRSHFCVAKPALSCTRGPWRHEAPRRRSTSSPLRPRPACPPVPVARLAVLRRARRGEAHVLLLTAPLLLLQRPRTLAATVPFLQVGAIEIGHPHVDAVGLRSALTGALHHFAGSALRCVAAGPRWLGRFVYADVMSLATILQLSRRPVVVGCGVQAIIRCWLGSLRAGLG